MWSVEMCFIFFEQINVIFKRPLTKQYVVSFNYVVFYLLNGVFSERINLEHTKIENPFKTQIAKSSQRKLKKKCLAWPV